MPGAVKTTVRLRDRSPLEGAPPGDGYSLVVEFFIETAGRARILTAEHGHAAAARTAISHPGSSSVPRA